MTTCIALLRAVNVGGTGKLPMAQLRSLVEAAGFSQVRTYIASGNVVFSSGSTPAQAREAIESRLHAHFGRPVDVMLRTHAELAAVLAANPFPAMAPNRTLAIFLHDAPPPDLLQTVSGLAGEVLVPGTREIYVHYPDGMAGSKLKIPAARLGTARNMNTIAQLVRMSATQVAAE